MAEFCLDCLRRIDQRDYKEENVIVSRDLELCEGCGEWKQVVVGWRSHSLWETVREFAKDMVWRLRSKRR